MSAAAEATARAAIIAACLIAAIAGAVLAHDDETRHTLNGATAVLVPAVVDAVRVAAREWRRARARRKEAADGSP